MPDRQTLPEHFNNLVTDEMVENATRAAWDQQREHHPGYDFGPFESKDEDLRRVWLDETRAALVAFLGSALGPGTKWTVYDAIVALNAKSADPVWKARRLWPEGLEALVVSQQDDGDYRIDANRGHSDDLVADDLDYETALGVAHALDVVYGCGVYEDGKRL